LWTFSWILLYLQFLLFSNDTLATGMPGLKFVLIQYIIRKKALISRFYLAKWLYHLVFSPYANNSNFIISNYREYTGA